MFTTALIHVPLLLVPLLNLPGPTQCRLEVLASQAVEERTLADFDRRVTDYVALRRRLEPALPSNRLFDPEAMDQATEALRAAIVEARPDARAGDIFTAGIGALLRARLEAAIVRHGYKPSDILGAINDGRMPGIALEVNGTFPWMVGPPVWPALVAALPPLPPALAYEFDDRTLVLIDIDTDLVVDVLADALPAGGRKPFRRPDHQSLVEGPCSS